MPERSRPLKSRDVILKIWGAGNIPEDDPSEIRGHIVSFNEREDTRRTVEFSIEASTFNLTSTKITLETPQYQEVTLEECPPGFFMFNDQVCLKTKVHSEFYLCDTGEDFSGETSSRADLLRLMVRPILRPIR